MRDAVSLADHVEGHRSRLDGAAVAGLLGEVDAVVGPDGLEPVGCGLKHVLKDLPGRLSVSYCLELSDGHLVCPVDADVEKELPFSSLYFGEVDLEEPDGVALKLLTYRLVALDIRQAKDAMPLKAPVQHRPRQVGDRQQESIKTDVHLQQCVQPESDDLRFLLLGQDRRVRFRRPGRHILDRCVFVPLLSIL